MKRTVLLLALSLGLISVPAHSGLVRFSAKSSYRAAKAGYKSARFAAKALGKVLI